MKPIEAIEQMMKRSGTPSKALAGALGRSPQSISNLFHQPSPDMRMSTMLGACACTGYRMFLVSENGDRIEIDLPKVAPESGAGSPEP